MGLSKRNPRGNFNWQSRYLKRKAINCGQLDMPFDCNLLAPIPAIITTRLCVTTPPSTQVINAGNTSTVPSLIAQNTNNTYTLYKDGVMIDTQFVAFGGYEYTFSGTLASAGLYEVEITNQFGCTARSAPVQVDAYQVPTVTATVVDSNISCVPPPIGGPGDGEVTLTVTNPVPGYTYTFRLCYDLGPPIFQVCYPDQTSVSVSATFTGLCPARYFGTVCVEVPGQGAQCCSSSLTIDVANAVIPPVANFSGSPTTVYEGDTVNFTDLSTNTPTSWSWAFAGGTPATSTTQNPSVVYNTAGTYGVDLTASNIAGSDLESKPNYITVNFPYLLDIYPNAAAAYSLRKLRSSYAGNCIRVRRTSDNTELNIGFVNNFLDTATLVSFVGAGSGFVTRFYDQSGNNRDSIQTSAFNQPRIINAGVLYTENGKAAINCYDANRCAFNITQGGFGGNTILTNVSYAYAFLTGKTAQTNVTRRTMLSIASVNTNSGRFFIGTNGTSTNTMVAGGKRLDTDALEQTSATTHGSAYSLFTGVADYANAAAYIYKNGVLGGSKVPFQTAGATSNTSSYNYESYIGLGRGDIFGGIENGSVSEVVIYNTDQSSNRAAIETNIKNYFGL